MKGYTKLFGRILDSSIWCENHVTVRLWITMLAMSGEDGVVLAARSALAHRAHVTDDECKVGLEKFLAPDPDSMTSDFEGRRIKAVEGGWLLLNHAKYRNMMSLEERREYHRIRRAKQRAMEKEARKGLTAREIIKDTVAASKNLHGDFA